MANPGTGFRTANSVLLEMSFHLAEPIVNTTLTSGIGSGLQTAAVGSTTGMYTGALLVMDLGNANQEIVTISSFVVGVSFTATFANSHNAGAIILTATFPIQQPTDPFFSQSEMLAYVSRAQNELLARMPSVLQLFTQNVTFGQIFQTTPSTAIEIDRIAASSQAIALTSLTRTSNVVTVVSTSPHGLAVGAKVNIFGTSNDAQFGGVFTVATVTPPTTFTYAQTAGNNSATGGTAALYLRLMEKTIEEITLLDRSWPATFGPFIRSWFEDRTGVYRWGVHPKPSATFPAELLCGVRDTDTLALTDGFLVPDPIVHLVKYKALEYAWSKDGEQRDPNRAQYCNQRFERGVMAVDRWMDGVMASTSQPTQNRGAR